ncbi:hypothetical protein MHBO_002742, partial [Bonamia ostreae]
KSVTIDDVYDSIEKALNDKAPRVREQTLIWLVPIFQKDANKIRKNVGNLAKIAMSKFEDGSVTVRSKSHELFSILLDCDKNGNDDGYSFVGNAFIEMKRKNPRAHKTITRLRNSAKNNPNSSKESIDSISLTSPIHKKMVSPINNGENAIMKKFPSKKSKLKLLKENRNFEFPDNVLEIYGIDLLTKYAKSDDFEEKSKLMRQMKDITTSSFKDGKNFCNDFFQFLKIDLFFNQIDKTQNWSNVILDLLLMLTEIIKKAHISFDILSLEKLSICVRLFEEDQIQNDFKAFLTTVCENIGPEKVLQCFAKPFLDKMKNGFGGKMEGNFMFWVEELFEEFDIFYFGAIEENIEIVEAIMASCESEIVEKRCQKIIKHLKKSTKTTKLDKITKNKNWPKLKILISDQTWQKRLKALESIKKEIKNSQIEQIEEILPLLNERFKENILIINRQSIDIVSEIFLVFSETISPKRLEKLFRLIEEGLFICLSNSNKQIRVKAQDNLKNWLLKTGLDFAATKISKFLAQKGPKSAKAFILKLINRFVDAEKPTIFSE